MARTVRVQPKLNPRRAPTNQLPYRRDAYMDGTPGEDIPLLDAGLLFRDQGSSGLRAFGGWIREEFLRALQGREAARVYREMYDNSPVISAMLFAITQSMRKINWRVEPADDTPDALEAADFADSIRGDMLHTWDEMIVEALSMLHFGFAPMEIVYKRRLGEESTVERVNDPIGVRWKDGSKYDDGLIGVARLPLRGQETILKWYFDINGQVLGCQQQPWLGPLVQLPIEKLLLFRAQHYKNNPEGRALDPETIIPTPDGWRILDDLDEGDKVFDEQGQICYITGRKDWENRPCYKVTFDNGTEIIADENHLWYVQGLHQRLKCYQGRLLSTKDLTKKLWYGNIPKYSIPWAKSVDYPEQDLPIDPYVFGYWLGDGRSDAHLLACHVDDVQELVQYAEEQSFSPSVSQHGPNCCMINLEPVGTGQASNFGKILRKHNLFKNKHIPKYYQYSSRIQRHSLLCGLMDSDGSVSDQGQCIFSNTNYDLVSGVAELVRSLGCGKIKVRRFANENSNRVPGWTVVFSPNFIPFRLSRKVSRCKPRLTRENHYIHSVEPVSPRRTVCLEVNSKSHQFLISDTFIATHNSILRSSYRAYFFIKRIEEQEAIMFERLSGLPLLKVPNALLEAANAGNSTAMAALSALKKIITNVRVDEQMGILLPSDTWAGPNGPTNIPMYEFELVTPKSTSLHVSSDIMIKRYNLDILKTVLADFIDLGHQARGTQNLAINKVDMFYQAIEGWLNSMASVFNRYLLPRVWALNALDRDLMPRFVPDLAQRVDLDVLSNFILRLAQSGARMFPDTDLENFLRDSAGLPEINEDLYDDDGKAPGTTEVAGSVIKPDETSDRSTTSPTATPAATATAKWLGDQLAKQLKKEEKPYRIRNKALKVKA